MQQTFVFSHGKVVLENGILYIRKTKPSYTLSEALLAILPFTFAARFVLYLEDEDSSKRNAGLVITGFLVVSYLLLNITTYYTLLFKRSFSNRIPVKNINASRVEEDNNGLEVHFFLQLKSGRERKITFRKLEKQYEELAVALSQYNPIRNFAC
ncbi:MAG: hypothetical protein EOO14_08820 [Chitinophagaceae bacterium]|nr:MAG: hypothetical protein EOO14_08820 [Chitinophagaceae bacterium]